MMPIFHILFFILLGTSYSLAQHNIEELGKINWLRNYEEAKTQSEKQNKDILILFQEVPGCNTCKNYGNNTLSHPLIVDAIESLFIPLVIFNNKSGNDTRILELYQEPSWNNPVVRIVSYTGENVLNRLANNYTIVGLTKYIKSALAITNKVIPSYLDLLEAELSNQTEEITFSMFCFWSGENLFGALNGVINTTSGYQNNQEVVKITYNPEVISSKELKDIAHKNNYNLASSGKFNLATKDLHYFLGQTDMRYLPLSDIQKTKINSAIYRKIELQQFLSPTQIKWYNQIKKNKRKKKDYLNTDIVASWYEMEQL